jgi:hypothetical protein
MKAFSIVLFVLCLFWMGGCVGAAVLADYDYSNHIQSYWDLSVKASTLQQKSEYLDKYVSALESASLAENDALFLKTPDNNIAQNMIALKSLQTRMHEIFGMDVNSFQYQQAIQQITAQEQDDAKELLSRFAGAWYLQHHFFLWDWMGFVTAVVILVITVLAGIFVRVAWDLER